MLESKEQSIDIKGLIYKFLNHWHFFLSGLIISLIIVFIYMSYQTTLFSVKTSVLINDDQAALDTRTMIGFGLLDRRTKLNNEIETLKTHELKQKAINALNIDVSYYKKDRKTNKELYTSSPFTIDFDAKHFQLINKNFYVKILSKDSFAIVLNAKNITLYNFLDDRYKNIYGRIKFNAHYRFYDTIQTNYFKFSLSLNDNYVSQKTKDDLLCFTFNDKHSKIKEFSSINFKTIKESSIVEITLTGNNAQKLADLLNQLTKAFLEKEVDKKNEIAINTIGFIDNYLNQVTDSLNYSEFNLQEYQSSKSLVSMNFQAEYIYNSLKNLQNQKAEILVNNKYYEYLNVYLKERKSFQDLILPATMEVNDVFLNKQVLNLTDLLNELKELEFNTKKSTPYTEAIKDKIKNIKSIILENIENNFKTSKLALNEINQRIKGVEAKINQLPKTQRELFTFERKFKLNDAVYTYLMQKRSETLIAKAANHPINEILEAARKDNYKIASTNKKTILIIGILLGLIIPGVIVYLIYYFNENIISDDEIKSYTNVPILGHIIHNPDNDNLCIFDKPASEIAESFRMLRTNLQFIAPKNNKNIILVSSGFKGEGKSFLSFNLSSAISLYDKKTIFLNFDLRKSSDYSPSDKVTDKGLSTYLSNNCELEDIILKTHFDNLDTILPGLIPPNPTELIASSRTEELFGLLKKIYDYIVVDTPPIGIISDALLLSDYSNVNLIAVRHNCTRKKLLADLIDNINIKKLKNINIVVNDIVYSKNRYGYAYSYGYGYKYKYK